jgi:hypothetical protein
MKKAAKKAVGDKIEEATFTPKEAPAFTDRVLEIDPELLAGLLKGFDAEVAYAKTASKEYQDQVKAHEKAREAWEKAVKDHDKAVEGYGVCRDRFMEKERASEDANQARIDKALEDMDDEEFEAHLLDLAERGEKLAKEIEAGRNDPETQRKWEEYQRETQVVILEQQRRAMLAMSGAVAESRRQRTEDPRLVEACGKEPERPAEPLSPMGGPEGVLAAKGAEAAGLTTAQYSIMRERVIAYAQADGRPTNMGYSEGEIRVLKADSEKVFDAFERMRKGKVPF